MKAKSCSHLGFPRAAGLFQTAPHAAGPIAKLVEKPRGEGRWPEMLNWVCSLGGPRKGTDESGTGLVGLGLFALDSCPDLTFGLKGEGSQIIART